MRTRSIFTLSGLVSLFCISLVVVACGGDKKKAKDPSTDSEDKNDKNEKWENPTSDDMKPRAPSGDSSSAPADSSSPSGAATHTAPVEAAGQRHDVYDKDATEVVLKRAARQVKANCGAATDENGKAAGPFGKVTINVNLGRNGHSKGVTVPAPFDGTPPGRCITQAFSNLTFPPWNGSDTPVDWEVEIVKPAGAK